MIYVCVYNKAYIIYIYIYREIDLFLLSQAKQLGRSAGPMASLTAERLIEALRGIGAVQEENARRFAESIQDATTTKVCSCRGSYRSYAIYT